MTIVDFKEVAAREKIIAAPSLAVTLPHQPERFFTHGWQSWSLASWTGTDGSLPIQKPRLLNALQLDPLYVTHPRPHGSWVGAVRLHTGVLLAGSLGLDAHVDLRDGQLRGWYDEGAGDWLVIHGSEKSVFARYAALLGERLGKSGNWKSPRVWCSWYSLRTAIDEPVLPGPLKASPTCPSTFCRSTTAGRSPWATGRQTPSSPPAWPRSPSG
jgi:alpha-galactosidase